MQKITKSAQAGTLESSDILITVAPAVENSGIVIDLDSIVMARYGRVIQSVILDTVKKQELTDVFIKAVDRGALDCTIQARTLTALARAGLTLKEGNG